MRKSSQKEVISMFNILNKWFDHIKSNQLKIPPNFNVHSIINTIIKMLESSLAFGIIYAINFWYYYGDLFLPETNVMVIKIICKFYFFKLYLHWSKKVREVFHLFLAYKIVHMFEHLESQDIERLVWRLNKNLASIKIAHQTYEIQRLKWDNQSKLEKKRRNIEKVKSEVVNEINRQRALNRPVDNFLPFSKKFARTHQLSFDINRNSVAFISEQNVFNFDTQEKVIKKIYNYQNVLKNKRESTLEPENLSYCRYANEEFREVLQKYYNDLEQFGEKAVNFFPKLNLNVLMDEFELKDNEISDW